MYFFVPAFITFIGCLLSLKLFEKLGLMDKPWKYDLKRSPIPYSVGIVTFVIFTGSCLLFTDMSTKMIYFLSALTLLTVTAFIDDFRPLSPWLRLFIQFIAGIILVRGGLVIHSISNPFGEPFSLDTYKSVIGGVEIIWLAGFFTILWVIVLVNSMNWLDGISGMTSGVGAIASFVIYLLSIRPEFHVIDQTNVTEMSAILASILLVVVFFDIYPPKLLLGDSGSMLIGFCLAVFSIFSGGKVATAILILGFPLIDFFRVIVERILQGRSPLSGKDNLHLHDKLMQLGWSKRQIIVLVYSLACVFGIIALYLNTFQKIIALSALFVIMGALAIITIVKSRKLNR